MPDRCWISASFLAPLFFRYHLPLTNSPWPGIINLFPARGSLVSDIPSGEGKTANLFLQCIANSCLHALPPLLNQMCEAWSSSSSVLGSSSSSPTLIMAIVASFSPHLSQSVIAIYDLYSQCVMLLLRASSITRASGRGLAGPWKSRVFGPCEMA